MVMEICDSDLKKLCRTDFLPRGEHLGGLGVRAAYPAFVTRPGCKKG